MRRLLVTLALASSFPAACTALPVSAAIEDANQRTGGHVVDGTPVAVAVMGAEGEIARYQSPGTGPATSWTCRYYGTRVVSTLYEAVIVDEHPTTPDGFGIYALRCVDAAGVLVRDARVLWDPSDPLGGIFAAERAAELAAERLDLPVPGIALNPPGDQVLGVPTWLALDLPWVPVSATATVSRVEATVVAEPVSVRWRTGDGSSKTCHGPGERFDPEAAPGSQASSCTHVYSWPSYLRPGGSYDVDATVTWAVRWTSSDGRSGDLGELERTSSTAVRALERQPIGRTGL